MTNIPVTDADREALLTHCDSLLNGIPYNGRGYAESRESARRKTRRLLEKAIARARADADEAFALECEAVCPPAGLYTPGELSAYEAAVQDCAAAIRARGEGGKA